MGYNDWKRHADLVFRRYKENKEKIESLLLDVSYKAKNTNDIPVAGGKLGDPVSAAIIELSSNRSMSMDKEIKAVESVLKLIGERPSGGRWLTLLDEIYWQGKPIQTAAQDIGVSLKTARKWRKSARILLSKKLGWD